MSVRHVPNGVQQCDLDHFYALPLAASTLTDPKFELISVSRTLTPDRRGHTLMASTWNTPSTIPHLLTLHRHSRDSNRPLTGKGNGVGSELRRFYTFGYGLNSHSDILHGGVLSTVIDSTMSNVAGLGLREITEDENASVVTAQLTVKFLGPVRTPGTVKVSAWVSNIQQARKVWVEAEVEGDGGIVAKSEGLWIRIQKEQVQREGKL